MAEGCGTVNENIDLHLNYDEATLAQVEMIQKEIQETSEYVSDKADLLSLANEYPEDDTIYQAKIKDLCKRYSHLRRTRGDGNCFFRAFSFGCIEGMLQNATEMSKLKEKVTALKDKIAASNPAVDYDEFHEVFIDVLDAAAKPKATLQQLLESFRDPSVSDYTVCYLRILTSGYLQLNSDFFQAFIEGGLTVEQYCNREVDPMYRESDHIHISALTAALDISVCVEYMDRGKGGQVNTHCFPEDASPGIHLLYRPGHYDILYPSSEKKSFLTDST